ncbi:MAG: hypothetical protein AABW80_04965 [Nanoarchaeota archaeon]
MSLTSTRLIEHPGVSGFPFIELSGIVVGNIMQTPLKREVVGCPPFGVNGRAGSYFNTVWVDGDSVAVRTMMGRSDQANDAWVYASEDVTLLDPTHEAYREAVALLKEFDR